MSDYTYDAVVVRVKDADTAVVDVDFGFNVWWRDTVIRLLGINSPELNCPAGKAAHAFLQELLPVGCRVLLESYKDKPDKFGARWLGILWKDGQSVNDLLVKAGHAVIWDGKGKKPT